MNGRYRKFLLLCVVGILFLFLIRAIYEDEREEKILRFLDNEAYTNFSRCDAKECVECPSDFIPNRVFIDSIEQLSNSYDIHSKANAVIVILCRNNEMEGVIKSLASFEPFINSKLQYPYVLLNDEEFTLEFKSRVSQALDQYRANAKIKFSLIPKEDWSYPEWINKDKAKKGYISSKFRYRYGGLESYRFMIRYFSGPFFHHPDLLEYDYYWRVEPNVEFHCEIQYDPFLFMKQKSIKYGFNMIFPENMETIATLYNEITKFKSNANLSDSPMMDFFVQNGRYTGFHFWSNFEIADFRFFRSKLYIDYFNHLDRAGGFFYERWGDAPVHSLAVGLFLQPQQVHYFGDIGYTHEERYVCPRMVKGCQLNCATCKNIETASIEIDRWYRVGKSSIEKYRIR